MALNGLQPELGHEVLWGVRDCLWAKGCWRTACFLAPADDLAPLLREVAGAASVPVTGVLRH